MTVHPHFSTERPVAAACRMDAANSVTGAVRTLAPSKRLRTSPPSTGVAPVDRSTGLPERAH